MDLGNVPGRKPMRKRDRGGDRKLFELAQWAAQGTSLDFNYKVTRFSGHRSKVLTNLALACTTHDLETRDESISRDIFHTLPNAPSPSVNFVEVNFPRALLNDKGPFQGSNKHVDSITREIILTPTALLR
ncbi:hypothetical protein KM043_005036 [Ampulex compressa]|nr:hypothetical protein KM043_005036 [Ampulex compressa]